MLNIEQSEFRSKEKKELKRWQIATFISLAGLVITIIVGIFSIWQIYNIESEKIKKQTNDLEILKSKFELQKNFEEVAEKVNETKTVLTKLSTKTTDLEKEQKELTEIIKYTKELLPLDMMFYKRIVTLDSLDKKYANKIKEIITELYNMNKKLSQINIKD